MLEDNNLSENVNETVIQEEKKESWLIEIVDGLPRSYMDTQYLNPGITYFENSVEVEKSEIDINNLRLYKLKDGKLKVNKELQKEEERKLKEERINKIKKELYALRLEHEVKPFEIEVGGVTYLQNNRSIDQSNLTRIVVMCQAMKKTSFDNWKFYTKDGSEKYVNISLADMMRMATIMQEHTTKSMATETLLSHALENLTDEELKNYNAKDEYEKAYKNIG